MFDDLRSTLRRADDLARRGRYADAIALYQTVAQVYADSGMALKALAVSRSIVQLVDGHAPDLTHARQIAADRAESLCAQLGLSDQPN